jgi:hypothetical protein
MDLKFNLKQLHEFEDGMKEFLRSVHVKDVNDISKSTLKSVHKDPLVEHAFKLVKLLKSSHEMLKSAAADLDILKCEQLRNQSRLIKVQEDLNAKKSVQLDSVKNTVDEKLTTWSSVVAKNSGKKVIQTEMKKAVKLAISEQDRERNVIMFNVPEREINDKNEHHDGQLAFKIMQRAGLPEQDGHFDCKRIGVTKSSRIRPLKVTFSSKSTAFELLLKSKNLKDDELYSNVFIVPDQSPEERAEHKKLVELLKAKRAENPTKRFFIWNKSIRSDN